MLRGTMKKLSSERRTGCFPRPRRSFGNRIGALVLLLVPLACTTSAPFEGLAPRGPAGGPIVVFDLRREPLPEIPFPSDLATRADPQSPTGLRVNSSLIAPTRLEEGMRSKLDRLDGFGTFMPISVAFDHDLDVLDLYNRQNNADPKDDGVYLVNLRTGATSPLDFNGGHFPYTLSSPDQYFRNDPNGGVTNLLFPTQGALPNFLHPPDPNYPQTHGGLPQQTDDLLTFYERATHTLILRPVLPLAEETPYAVVITNRVRDAQGRPVVSPHSGINHAAQTVELQPLLRMMPAGVQLSDLAYAWAFTTQTTTTELGTIAAGMFGTGPLRYLSLQFPVQVGTSAAAGLGSSSTVMTILQETGSYDQSDANCRNPSAPSTYAASPNADDYRLPAASLAALLRDPAISGLLIGSDPAEVKALVDSLAYVDYFVSGFFLSPSFLDTADGSPFDSSFQIDLLKGDGRVQPATVPFLLAVPKQRPELGHLSPFPVVIAGHGDRSSRIEPILGFSGTFAKFGLATISIDAYGHGISIDPTLKLATRQLFCSKGLLPFFDALFTGRARDLNNSGTTQSGGDFWTANAFHTRDVVRQSTLDWVQLVRLLQTFNGQGTMRIGGANYLAGDFNNDQVPDLGGPQIWPQDVFLPRSTTKLFTAGSYNPGSDTFFYGVSLGGILTGVANGVPALSKVIRGAVPVSLAGGLSDVALRSTLGAVVQPVFLELFGPIFANCPYSLSENQCDAGAADAKPTLILIVQDVNQQKEVPIAPLSLSVGDVVTACNLTQLGEGVVPAAGAPLPSACKQVTADSNGNLRLPIAADSPQLQSVESAPSSPGFPNTVDTQVLRPGDRLALTVTHANGAPVSTIDTFQFNVNFDNVSYSPTPPAHMGQGCLLKSGAAGPAGPAHPCQLVSVARGFGLSRNTPEFRRRLALSQMILDPGDPINYAPLHTSNLLVVGTSGDPGVPISGALNYARAAGLVEMNQPDPAYLIPLDQVLIRSGVDEGVANTRRIASTNYGPRADPALGTHVRCDPGADCQSDVLIDSTGYSCDPNGTNCLDGLNAPRLDPPLQRQLTRSSGTTCTFCPAGTPDAPAPPCASTGATCTSIGASACAPGAVGSAALLIPYLNRTGQHGFSSPIPQKPFDIDLFLANLIGRYFECRGGELHFERCQALLDSDPARCQWIPAPPQ